MAAATPLVAMLISGAYMFGAFTGGRPGGIARFPQRSPPISADYTASAAATACPCRRSRCNSVGIRLSRG